jgi:hypothetical protein
MTMVGRYIAALASLLLLITPAAAEAQAVKAGIVTTAEGHVAARRVVLPQPVPLKFKDDVFLEDTITTGDRSLARLLLGGKAVVTVRERSALTITEVPGRSTVALGAGKIGMAVARDRMRPGEVIDIRTPNAIVAVRGTVLVVEVRRATAQAGGGSDAPATDVYLLRDRAEVSALDPRTGAPIGPPVLLQSGQRFTVVGTALPQVTGFTTADEAQIVEGLQSRSVPHQEAANRDQIKGMLLDTTATLLAAVTGTGPERLALAPGDETPAPASTEPAPATPTAPPIIPEIPPALEEPAAPAPAPTPPPTGAETFITGDLTIPAGQTLRTFSGAFSRTQTAPLIQVVEARVSQQGPDNMIEVRRGASVDLASLLLDIRDSQLSAGASLLRVGGLLVGENPSGLVAVDPSALRSAGDLIRVDPGGGILTFGPLLNAVDTGIVTRPGQLLHVLGDAVGENHGFVLTSGTLLSFTRSDLDLANNLVRLADGGILEQFGLDETVAAAPLVVFRDSTYRGGLGPQTVTGGSLLRMFSQQGASAGSALLLTGPFLDAVGSRFEGREAPLFNIADGAQILSLSARPFASFERSSVSSASGFFNLDTHTQFGPPAGAPPGTPPTVGSGGAVSVFLAGSLVRATDTNFTVNGDFLRLHNRVFLDQTGPSPLIALEGSAPGGVRVTASGNVLNLAASTDQLAPQLTLGGLFEGDEFQSVGGTLLSARNTVLANGDPARNVSTFAFVADGARLVTRGPDPLFVFEGATLDTAGNVLTLRRSPRPGPPSTVELAGPLMMATGSSFNTTSLGLGSACCSGFFVGEGAQLTSATTGALITLIRSTFNSGPDSQSGGSFFSLSTAGGVGDATPAPGSMNLAGPLLFIQESGVSSLFNTLNVTGSTLNGSSRDPLIHAVNSWISAGGLNPFTGTTTFGRLLLVSGAAADPARVELHGPVLLVSVDPEVASGRNLWLDTTGGLIAVLPGTAGETQTVAELVAPADRQAPAPLATVRGGSHVLGSLTGASILDFRGRATAPTASQEVEGTTVTWRTDQPIQTPRALLLSDGATISGQKLARFDRMLFEATAPIFQGQGRSVTNLNGPNAIELSYQAKVTSLAPVMMLDASVFNLLSGDLIFVNGSFLSVAGDLLSLSNGSRLNLSDGAVLNVTGNSVVLISGAFVKFSGSGNQINIANSACPANGCRVFGPEGQPIRVALTGGARVENVSIQGNVVKDDSEQRTGGTISYTTPNAAAIVVNGSGSRVVIRGR